VLTDNDKKQFVRRCVDEATVELGLYKQNTVFIEHATLIVVFSTSDKLSHIMSCCAAIQNLLLAATCFGLGSVWMYRPIALDKHIKALKKLLKVPRNYVPIGVVAVGYSKARPRAPKRLPLSQIMFYNTMSR
jgi:nitroreductase